MTPSIPDSGTGELAPCPFCGGVGVSLDTLPTLTKPLHYASCLCGARGPDRRTDADAIAAWNRRAVETAAGDDLVRYDAGVEMVPEWGAVQPSMTESADGAWVAYDQAAALLATVTRERDEARDWHEHFVAENEINKARAQAAESALAALKQQAVEACAKVAEAHANNWNGTRDVDEAIQNAAKDDTAKAIAAAIRALASEPTS